VQESLPRPRPQHKNHHPGYRLLPHAPRPPSWFRRLRQWWRHQQYRLGQWFLSHLPHLGRPESETAALQLLVLALTVVVLFQAVLLVLAAR
jgi:hypothetical protein